MVALPALTRLLLVPVLLALPSAARAHIALRASEPAADATLRAAPAHIVLWFTMRPQTGFSRVTLAGPGGEIALDAPVADSGNAIRAAVPGVLPPGSYTVRWQTASADGHVIRGSWAFTIADTAPGVTAGPTRSDAAADPHAATPAHVAAPDAHVEHADYRWVRWAEFVALVTVLGALGFRHGVLPPLAARGVPTADAADRARRLGQNTLVLYALAAAQRLYAESAVVHGESAALDPELLWRMLGQTTWGAGWLAGAAGAFVLFAGWRLSRRNVGIGTPLALLGGAAMAVAPALSGHAAAARPMLLSVTADALHVAAAGVWTGGLLMVLLAGIPAMKRGPSDVHPAVAALVNSFHPIALFCVPLVVLSGAMSAWLRLGGLDALWATTYGRTLLVKLAVFAAVAGIGFRNAVRVRRQLGTEAATRRLRRSAAVELAFVALLLAVTTWLVVTPVPSDPTA